ncbi:hypothetical protein CJJ23_02940 [Mycoplasmopsis agassizii]|uniref:DUF2779 domain-containing protein n=1 Tax=Mycoplasmopsis agassizii TaxID=33922 RepID=A0A269TII0_9BACT|nr:hypothetical protein [Mycoplasmopsis agassizii]PAK21279.1 hypothetical protein CJJ23_02940 [Mycoplasmopsis agassizii]
MKKIIIYIDFESISTPFNSGLRPFNKDNWLPFAYSMGTYVNSKTKGEKEWKIITTMIDFSRLSDQNSIIREVRRCLINDLKKWFGRVDEELLFFKGFAPQLEKKILAQVMPLSSIESVFEFDNIKLSLLTKESNRASYFPYLKSLVKEKFNEKTIKSIRLNQDGALAAYAGALLYSQSRNIFNRFYMEFDHEKLLEEFLTYSEEDVQRMRYIVDNFEKVSERAQRILKIRTYREDHRAQAKRLENLLEHLKSYNFPVDITIAELYEIIESDIAVKRSLVDKLATKIEEIV